MDVMREHAEKLGCPYYELKREDTEIHKITKDGIRFSLKDETYGDTVFDIPFIARYQVMNAASLHAHASLRPHPDHFHRRSPEHPAP